MHSLKFLIESNLTDPHAHQNFCRFFLKNADTTLYVSKNDKICLKKMKTIKNFGGLKLWTKILATACSALIPFASTKIVQMTVRGLLRTSGKCFQYMYTVCNIFRSIISFVGIGLSGWGIWENEEYRWYIVAQFGISCAMFGFSVFRTPLTHNSLISNVQEK